VLSYEVLPGITDLSEVWDTLSLYWRERTYTTDDDRTLPIYLHGIDHGGHWVENVERFCADHGPREFLPIKGRLGVDREIADFPRRPRDAGVWLVNNNTDTTKLTIYKRVEYERDVELWENPGCISFPVPQKNRYQNFDERFYKMITSESRLISPSGKPEWKENGRNEPLDLLSMNLCLIRVAQLPQYGLRLDGNEGRDLQPSSRRTRRYDLRRLGRDLNTRTN
jgi:phage terminase large subunit GpA-like protein